MGERDCTYKALICQIREEKIHLVSTQHPFVSQSSCGHTCHHKISGIEQSVAYLISCHIKQSLQLLLSLVAIPSKKELLDDRHCFSSLFANVIRIDRHIPPTQANQVVLTDNALDRLHAMKLLFIIMRQEHCCYPIASFSRKNKPQLSCFFSQECIWYLYKDPSAITGFWISTNSSTMIQIAE